jgi:hypothetical protein
MKLEDPRTLPFRLELTRAAAKASSFFRAHSYNRNSSASHRRTKLSSTDAKHGGVKTLWIVRRLVQMVEG